MHGKSLWAVESNNLGRSSMNVPWLILLIVLLTAPAIAAPCGSATEIGHDLFVYDHIRALVNLECRGQIADLRVTFLEWFHDPTYNYQEVFLRRTCWRVGKSLEHINWTTGYLYMEYGYGIWRMSVADCIQLVHLVGDKQYRYFNKHLKRVK